MQIDQYQTFGYRDIELTPREMKALYIALDRKLCDLGEKTGHLLTLNLNTLSERLRENEEDIIRISTGTYWGFWKCVTRKEIVWEFSRYQAIKLRALLALQITRRRKAPIRVTKRLLDWQQLC